MVDVLRSQSLGRRLHRPGLAMLDRPTVVPPDEVILRDQHRVSEERALTVKLTEASPRGSSGYSHGRDHFKSPDSITESLLTRHQGCLARIAMRARASAACQKSALVDLGDSRCRVSAWTSDQLKSFLFRRSSPVLCVTFTKDQMSWICYFLSAAPTRDAGGLSSLTPKI